MKLLRLALAVLLMSSFGYPGVARAASQPSSGDHSACNSGASPQTGSEWVQCETSLEGSLQAGGASAAAISPQSGVTYTYMWIPACPSASPDNPASATVDCQAARTCADPQLISLSLYAMQVTNAAGNSVNNAWTYLGSECRRPSTAGPTQQPRVLTWTDVLSAIREIGVPGGSVKGPDFTLVNLKTTFFTVPATIDRPLSIIGYDVNVHVAPSSYTWHWGDGATETTDTPGRPYPATDVTHTYRHATAAHQPLQVSVDVTYTAQYQVNGGVWQQVPDALTIPGQPRDLPVKQASAVLVAGQ